MKCIVLAGGTGDKLWPLSRREYPKQFMNIKEDRSLLQETIGRNLSLCEEFFIMANFSHSFIIDAQMSFFQGIKYRCFYEEIGKETALPIVLAAMSLNQSELIYVVNADHIIYGDSYKIEILNAMDKARGGKIVLLQSVGFVCTAGALLNEIALYSEKYYNACKRIYRQLNTYSRNIIIPAESVSEIEKLSIEAILYNYNNDKSHVAEGKKEAYEILIPEFISREVDSFEVFDGNDMISNAYKNNIVEYECRNNSIINRTQGKLVVVNGINDAIVVNTEDALYITDKNKVSDLKHIIEKNMQGENKENEKLSEFFMHGSITYRPWGYRELLKKESSFMVRKVLLLPGKSIDTHKHTTRSEHWSVVEGKLSAVIDGVFQVINKNMSAFVPVGIEHSLHNDTDENVILIEVSTGHNIIEKDMITTGNDKKSDRGVSEKKLIKLEPAFKDYIWGGTKLRDVYGKKCDYDKIAESWELSAHKAGNSIIASGIYKGRTFSDYLDISGKEILGWKAENFIDFPILIKFIDARDNLSIQVHPNDEYALKYENELGKTEIWYIIDCDENASLYCGLNKTVSRDEIESRVENNTIIEILNKVDVHKGDVIYVEAGEIHAICGGIMLCEIQQNSNCTYRLYDYDRKDRFGNSRELHLDKALKVANLSKNVSAKLQHYRKEMHEGYSTQILVSCKYFECIKYDITEKADVFVDDASFKSFIIIEGSGVISDGETGFEFSRGDSYFIPAGIKKVEIIGKSVILVTHI